MAEPTPSEIEDRVRSRLLTHHRTLLRSIVDSAGDVTADSGGETTDRSAVVEALERELTARRVLPRVPAVIEDLASAAGLSLAAPPVAAPPYVTVTGGGLVIRLPTSTQRVVITVRTFWIGRNPPRYRRFEGDLGERLSVEVRQTP